MLKVLQDRLQQYVNWELPDVVPTRFRKVRETRDQIVNNIHWVIENGNSKKYIHFCFIDYTKAFERVDHIVQFSSVQSRSHVRLFATPWTTACQASPSSTNSQNPPKPMSIELVMPSNHLILCRPLLLLPSIFPSIRVFSNESVLCIRWPKYWSFSFNISPSNEHPGLIFFRMDWLDLLAVQGTLKSLLQHHSSKALVFFIFLLKSKILLWRGQ